MDWDKVIENLTRLKNNLGMRLYTATRARFHTVITSELLLQLGILIGGTLFLGPSAITAVREIASLLGRHKEEAFLHTIMITAHDIVKGLFKRKQEGKTVDSKLLEKFIKEFCKVVETKLSSATEEQRKAFEKSLEKQFGPDGAIASLLQLYELDKIMPALKKWFPTIQEQLTGLENEIKKIRQDTEKIQEQLGTSYLKLETVLDKDKFSEPTFLRIPYGPRWIDYENGYVADRGDIIKNVYKMLVTDCPQVILEGEPSSGKSSVLYDIGFRLRQTGKVVWAVDFLRNQNVDNEVQRISPLQQKAVLLLDNIHINPSRADDIIAKARECKVCVIAAGRPLKHLLGFQTHQTLRVMMEAGKAIKVEASDAFTEVINLFQKKKGVLLSPETTENLEQFRNDLWLLSIALNSIKDGKINREDIYEFLCDKWLNEHIKIDCNIKKAELPLLLLAFFSIFEIPVPESFLTALVEERTALDNLIKKGLLRVTEDRRVAHHHSSIAKLYLDAVPYCESLRSAESEIRRALQVSSPDESLLLPLFSRFLSGWPQYGCELFASITSRTLKGKSLVLSLARNNQNEILKAIGQEQDVWKIGGCVERIADASKEVARQICDGLEPDLWDKIQ